MDQFTQSFDQSLKKNYQSDKSSIWPVKLLLNLMSKYTNNLYFIKM